MKKIIKSMAAVALCAAMTLTFAGSPALTVAADGDPAGTVRQDLEDKKEEISEKLDEALADETSVDKDETVYVITDASGAVSKTIVSDTLKNKDGKAVLNDRSELSDVENVKDDNTFVRENENITWNADGDEIVYRGLSDRKLPVDVAITYMLDGNEIAPADLAGKSGHVTIKLDYTNNEKRTATINGKETEIFVPFAAVSVITLDGDKFSNVTVSSGRVSSDGNRTVAVGIAFPGLNDSLGVSLGKQDGTVTVEADAVDFELLTTVTLVTNEIFKDIEPDSVFDADSLEKKLEDIREKASALTDGASQLADALSQASEGSAAVNEGAKAVNEGAKALNEGVTGAVAGAKQLDEGLKTFNGSLKEYDAGMTQLSAGMAELTKNNDALVAGAKAVLDSSLASATAQLNEAGITVPALTAENYAAVLDKTVEGLSAQAGMVPKDSEAGMKLAAAVTAVKTAKAQLDSLNAFYMGIVGYTQGVSKAAESTAKLEGYSGQLLEGAVALGAGAERLSAGMETIGAGAVQLSDGADRLAAGTEALDNAIKQIRDGAVTLSDSLEEEDLDSLIDGLFDAETEAGTLLSRFDAVIDAARDYDNFSGKTDDMTSAVRFIYRSAEIR